MDKENYDRVKDPMFAWGGSGLPQVTYFLELTNKKRAVCISLLEQSDGPNGPE